jgi:hypothetical protein
VFSSRKQGNKYVQNTLLAPQEGLSSNANKTLSKNDARGLSSNAKKTLSNNDARGLSSNARGPNNNAKRLQ